jgi:hypothetical protein
MRSIAKAVSREASFAPVRGKVAGGPLAPVAPPAVRAPEPEPLVEPSLCWPSPGAEADDDGAGVPDPPAGDVGVAVAVGPGRPFAPVVLSWWSARDATLISATVIVTRSA